jgi:hypothetical protein
MSGNTSRQRRLDEQTGIFDPSGAAPGVAPEQEAPAPQKPTEKEPPKDDGAMQDVENVITAANALSSAANDLETASVYLRNTRGDHSTGEDLDKVRAHLLQISTTVREKLVKAAQKDPQAAERVRG